MTAQGRIPPLIRCPYCQPGLVMWAGVVVSRVCPDCRRELQDAAENREAVEVSDRLRTRAMRLA